MTQRLDRLRWSSRWCCFRVADCIAHVAAASAMALHIHHTCRKVGSELFAQGYPFLRYSGSACIFLIPVRHWNQPYQEVTRPQLIIAVNRHLGLPPWCHGSLLFYSVAIRRLSHLSWRISELKKKKHKTFRCIRTCSWLSTLDHTGCGVSMPTPVCWCSRWSSNSPQLYPRTDFNFQEVFQFRRKDADWGVPTLENFISVPSKYYLWKAVSGYKQYHNIGY
jgi:hypothetical protein